VAWVSIRYGGSPLEVQGGVGQLTVTHARAGDEVVVHRGDRVVGHGTADEQGASVVRDLAIGRYRVEQRRDGREVISRQATVAGPDLHLTPAAYTSTSASMRPGLNEIATADGTRLSAFVRLPGPAAKGPYPTVIEYSAYRIGDPGFTQPASAMARALGYATVGINVPGTGCSGGAFDMFSPSQAAAGYDAVETVAAQPWAKDHRVGLVGFSYGGLAALEVAATQPPSLRGVVALSVYGDAWGALHPGGLDNSGFPVGWAQSLTSDAQPSGTDWVRARISKGDGACARNQVTHAETVDLVARYLRGAPDDGRFQQLSPAHWAPSITAPVFLTSQFQDATLGADVVDHLAAFRRAEPLRVVLSNGTHGDGVSPQVVRRAAQFLAIFVAHEPPPAFDLGRLLRANGITASADALPVGPTPPGDVEGATDLASARRAYLATPPLEVLFESGNGGRPGAAAAATRASFPSWPPPATRPKTWYLGDDGALVDTAPTADRSSSFRTDPDVSGNAYNVEGSNLTRNDTSPWLPPDPSNSASWITTPFSDSSTLIGTGSVDLWIRADAADVDLQSTLSLVDPSGDETMVQVGWQRASERRLAPGSTPLLPRYRSDQPAPLQPGTWTKVRLRLGAVGQPVRPGDRLRLVVGTPGAGQVQWSFYPPPDGPTPIDIGQGGAHASTLVLGLLPGLDPPTNRAGCGDLRGQPCRRYQPAVPTR
jgi:predicted acyl esterase